MSDLLAAVVSDSAVGLNLCWSVCSAIWASQALQLRWWIVRRNWSVKLEVMHAERV
jgi:hypothetical protein